MAYKKFELEPTGYGPWLSDEQAQNYDPAKLARERLLNQTFSYQPYQESQKVKGTYNDYQTQLGAKPKDYESQYDGQIQEAFDKIMNRKDFQYDLGGDMLYQQMADRYTQQGQLAMEDTIGRGTALTGGYDNSYAQSAGQQTFGGYMQAINDKVPELRDRAYQEYAAKGDDMYNQLGLMRQMEGDDYGKYRDNYADWQTMLGHTFNVYSDERGFDYNKYSDDRSSDQRSFESSQNMAYNQQRDDYQNQWNQYQFGYNAEQDAANQSWNQQQFDYKVQQDALDREFQQLQWDTQQANAAAKASKGPSGPPKPKFTNEEIAMYEQMLAEEEARKNKTPLKQLYDPIKGTSGGYWR